MATKVGANLIEDGVVFGYDTYFGVADNSTTTRLYPGEPAVNLFGDISNANARPNRTEYNTSTWTASFQKPPEDVGRVYSHTSGSLSSTWSGNSYGYTLIGYSFLANTSYTLSCWVYVSSDCNITAMHQSMEGTTLTNTTNRWYDLNNKGTWQQLSITCNSSSAVSGNAIIAYPSRSGVTDGSHTGFWAIGGAKLEINTHVTPYVLGTRSSTESLIDLKKTTNIDVSNVSFDSTGQPAFDGTNDYINIPSSFRSYFTSAPVAVELVLKKSSADQAAMVVFDVDITRWNLNYNLYTSSQWAFDFYDGTEHVISAGNYDNEYVHFVLQQLSNGTMEIYANGILKGTITSSGNLAPNPSGPRIGSRSNGDSRYFKGELPVFKIFSKSLTVEEVKQNFNAYKNRFDI
jgi:hypothetical protein